VFITTVGEKDFSSYYPIFHFGMVQAGKAWRVYGEIEREIERSEDFTGCKRQ
jgi:hypothetical protein